MYTYLSLVIILSVSSSNASSRVLISLDTSGTDFICSLILSSFSRSLIAKNLFWASGISMPSMVPTAVIASSTLLSNSCTGVTSFFLSARLIAFSAAFWIPVPFSADISTTSHPNSLLSLSVCILSPAFSTRSIMLTAITTGIPSSMICVDRYRLRSMLVPSTMLMIASGLSLIR